MKILAIETSCDETAIAIVESAGPKTSPDFSLLANVVLSQIKVHQPFGGVVPNLAMREHQKNLVPILTTALRDAKMLKSKSRKISVDNHPLPPPPSQGGGKKGRYSSVDANMKVLSIVLSREQILLGELQKFVKKYEAPDIDAIAVTCGPGLEPALWVGINFAKALSAIWKKPLLPVNHLEGHIYAGFLPKAQNFANFKFPLPKDIFPALALIVSGGHTELVLVKKHLGYKILGETRDDAAGEAFDKVAKMLRLGYPGGPEISKLALDGSPTSINFPRPMINSNDFDFSFSGLKTAVLYYIREKEQLAQNQADIAASFEQAVIDVLVSKTAKALKKYKVKSLVVGGGVIANKKLRQSLEYMIKLFPNTELHLSPLWLTGDNATMVAVPAYFHSLKKTKSSAHRLTKTLRAQGNLRL